jgi:hypothetical protein
MQLKTVLEVQEVRAQKNYSQELGGRDNYYDKVEAGDRFSDDAGDILSVSFKTRRGQLYSGQQMTVVVADRDTDLITRPTTFTVENIREYANLLWLNGDFTAAEDMRTWASSLEDRKDAS